MSSLLITNPNPPKFEQTITKQPKLKSNIKQLIIDSPPCKNTFKTPKASNHYIQQNYPSKKQLNHTGDRFIPIKNDKENYQNFLLKTSKANPYLNNNNNNQSYINYNDINNISYKDVEGNKFSNFILDTLLFKSVNKFSIDIDKIGNLNKQKEELLSFSKNTKHKENEKKQPFLTQMKNYFNSSNFLFESKHIPRIISQTPERILDAPNLQDDYYLNLLDWGSLNILSVALGNEVYLWNGNTTETSLLMTSDDEDIQITSISWMNSGNCLAIGLSNGTVELWDTNKNVLIRIMQGHLSRVSSMHWNNYILSSGSKDTSILNHDVRNKNHIISRLTSHNQEVCALKYNVSDSSYLASGSNDNIVYIWDIRRISERLINIGDDNDCEFNIKPYHTLSYHKAAVKALAWCPWQRNVLATGGGSKDKCIKIVNCDNGNIINSYETGSQVCALLWNKRERELISSHGYNKNQICIWNYPKMTKVVELKGHRSRVLYLTISPDETTVVSGAGDETLRFWKINEKITEISKEDNDELTYNFSKIR